MLVRLHPGQLPIHLNNNQQVQIKRKKVSICQCRAARRHFLLTIVFLCQHRRHLHLEAMAVITCHM
ncbi:wsv300 [White spot syndrome virus]|uniref:Wsv300 n=4 Tax=White spot syndrome virus TaxID=342409 RepID=Q8VAT7_WSSVS|nr:wsv300 [Shrimp white spot syndrome virus]AFX59677.1 wsv300 [White spot syndrome virus]AAL33302.1 wsv300 [Shrimp white spot syndrome virus]AAL89224.1 WSSV356 [Shrimp white spot syndrome virus]AWQ60432.1 wsv300 [Shrimp white spot syndrome virus]AWQ60877.1 wsv300 [Shrimp white spot syndrome virus]